MYNYMNETRTSGTGLGLTTTLFLIFLVLKLTGAIDWSWWWVTSPLWLPIALVLAACCVVIVGALAMLGLRSLGK
jgi:hypothetical protein